MGFFDVVELHIQDILRNFSSGLLLPVMIVLIALAVYTVWAIVSVIVECLMQRRHFKENVPQFVDAIEAAPFDQVQNIIEDSQMLVSQKDALLIVAEHMNSKPADLYAIAKREVGLISERYQRITARTDMAAKVAPMFGLMGTLIPLGPGVVAMGQGNTEVLASSLLVAFDTTVAGLVTAAVCMIISKIRKSWYQKYLGALEASMTAILEKAESYRDAMGIPEGVDKVPAESLQEKVVIGNLPTNPDLVKKAQEERRSIAEVARENKRSSARANRPGNAAVSEARGPQQQIPGMPASAYDPTMPMKGVKREARESSYGPQEPSRKAYRAPLATTEEGRPIVDRSKMDGSYLRKDVDIPFGPDLSGFDKTVTMAAAMGSAADEAAATSHEAFHADRAHADVEAPETTPTADQAEEAAAVAADASTVKPEADESTNETTKAIEQEPGKETGGEREAAVIEEAAETEVESPKEEEAVEEPKPGEISLADLMSAINAGGN